LGVVDTPLFIYCHQGLGDQILCSGIYRKLSESRRSIIVPSILVNYPSVRQMLGNYPSIFVQGYRQSHENIVIDGHASLLGRNGFDILRLGSSGKDFFESPNMRLDENFYSQAGIELHERWGPLDIARNLDKELELFGLLAPKSGPYIFLHEDASRGFNIDLDLLPDGVAIVRADTTLSSNFTIFDYLTIIENASEIHCIESSFCALIESMQFDIPKFAHRYARPEAKADYRFEFTYRSKWEILL